MIGMTGVSNGGGMTNINQSSLAFDMGDDSGGITVPKASDTAAKNRQSNTEAMAEVENEGINLMIDERYQKVDAIDRRSNNYAESTQIHLDALMEQWESLSSAQDPGAQVKKMEIDHVQQEKQDTLSSSQLESDGLKQEASMYQSMQEDNEAYLSALQRSQSTNKSLSLDFS